MDIIIFTFYALPPKLRYLLAFPYFTTYHVLSSLLLRKINQAFADPAATPLQQRSPAPAKALSPGAGASDGAGAGACTTGWTLHNMVAVGALAYITAVLEAWSIGSFPGYWYVSTISPLT